jgi:hypothetical protein
MGTQKRLRLTAVEPTEAQVLRAVQRALELHPRVAWVARINSGAGRIQRAIGASQWMRFGFPGCSDLIGQTVEGLFLAVEVKRPSGKPTVDQTAFLERVRAAGGVAFVARSVDDVLRGF